MRRPLLKSSARVTVCGCRSASIGGGTMSEVEGEVESGVLLIGRAGVAGRAAGGARAGAGAGAGDRSRLAEWPRRAGVVM